MYSILTSGSICITFWRRKSFLIVKFINVNSKMNTNSHYVWKDQNLKNFCPVKWKINDLDCFLHLPSTDAIWAQNNFSHNWATSDTSVHSRHKRLFTTYYSTMMELQGKMQRSLSLDSRFTWEALRIRESKCLDHELTRKVDSCPCPCGSVRGRASGRHKDHSGMEQGEGDGEGRKESSLLLLLHCPRCWEVAKASLTWRMRGVRHLKNKMKQ